MSEAGTAAAVGGGDRRRLRSVRQGWRGQEFCRPVARPPQVPPRRFSWRVGAAGVVIVAITDSISRFCDVRCFSSISPPRVFGWAPPPFLMVPSVGRSLDGPCRVAQLLGTTVACRGRGSCSLRARPWRRSRLRAASDRCPRAALCRWEGLPGFRGGVRVKKKKQVELHTHRPAPQKAGLHTHPSPTPARGVSRAVVASLSAS